MRTRRVGFLFVALLLFGAAANSPLRAASYLAQDPGDQDQYQYQDQDQQQYEYQSFSPDQLDNLLAPIALYPDPLLAQVLVAATFPDQIDESARYLRSGADPNGIDDQPWDVSVKAVAHYPTVLYMMDNRLDWTTSLGQAYVNQSTDVETSIQRLRGMAYNAGALQSGPQIQVVQQGPDWCIWPVEPQLIYVPVYDPTIVFYGRPGWHGSFITFGTAFPIGAWLSFDFDWGHRGIYYHGWGEHLPVWAVRSRPYIRVTNVYVNNRYREVPVNREVVRRPVNYENLNRYNAVHREVNYSDHRQTNFQPANPRQGGRFNNAPPNQEVRRNINTGDTRIQDFRGREGSGARMTMEGQGRPQAPEQQRQPERQTEPQRPTEGVRPPPQRPVMVRPAPAPQVQQNRPPAPSAYNVERGSFSAREESQRGQASREAMSRPAPQSRPAPEQRSAPQGRPSGGGRRP